MTLGEKIAKQRKELNYTQEQLTDILAVFISLISGVKVIVHTCCSFVFLYGIITQSVVKVDSLFCTNKTIVN